MDMIHSFVQSSKFERNELMDTKSIWVSVERHLSFLGLSVLNTLQMYLKCVYKALSMRTWRVQSAKKHEGASKIKCQVLLIRKDLWGLKALKWRIDKEKIF
mgnify:CR=1 FL=1